MSEILTVVHEETIQMLEVAYGQSALSSIIHGSDDIQPLTSSQAGEILSAPSMPHLKQTGMKISSNVCRPSKENT